MRMIAACCPAYSSGNTAEECEEELNGQIVDGLFENYKVGKIEEI